MCLLLLLLRLLLLLYTVWQNTRQANISHPMQRLNNRPLLTASAVAAETALRCSCRHRGTLRLLLMPIFTQTMLRLPTLQLPAVTPGPRCPPRAACTWGSRC
jgi:hypothetical protein